MEQNLAHYTNSGMDFTAPFSKSARVEGAQAYEMTLLYSKCILCTDDLLLTVGWWHMSLNLSFYARKGMIGNESGL